jgi:hypothetical protein
LQIANFIFPSAISRPLESVPLEARAAILNIGLLSAVGEISLDDLRMTGATK